MIKNIFKNFHKNNWILFSFGIAIMLLTTIAMIYGILNTQETYKLNLERFFKQGQVFFYFTNQSNLFLGIAMIYLSFNYKKEKAQQLYFLSIVLITITFIIYWALISWTNDWTKVMRSLISTFTHAIHPLLGFITLFLIRKNLVIKSKTILYAGLCLLAYFIFAFVLYWSTYDEWETLKSKTSKDIIIVKQGISIYTFLNFKNPLFYKGANIPLIIFLDIFMVLLGLSIPIILSLVWIKTAKLKMINDINFLEKFKKNKNINRN